MGLDGSVTLRQVSPWKKETHYALTIQSPLLFQCHSKEISVDYDIHHHNQDTSADKVRF